jgi:heat shock protein HslJ
MLACTAAGARPPEAVAGVEGPIWQLKEYRTGGGLRSATPGAGHLYALFDDGRFMINAGCGTLKGRYWLDGETMLFSPHVESVVDDCPDVLRLQEQAVLDLLRVVDRADLRQDEVVLTDGSGRLLLILGTPDRAPLQGRTWALKAYRRADGIVVPALPAPVFTLMFEDASNLSGRACDGYRAVYQRRDRFLRLVGPAAVSRVGCGDDAALRQGEDFIAMLGLVDSYRVDTDTLLLRDGNGRMLAHFAPADDAAAAADGVLAPPRREDNLPPAPVPVLPFVDR